MKLLCTLSLSVLVSISAFSQISHTVLNPVIKLDSWNSQEIQIDSDITATNLHASLFIWEDFNTKTDVNSMGNCEVIMDSGYPAALDMDASISPAANWQAPSYSLLFDGTNGNWQNKTEKYLGVRIKENNQWHYGWIKMDVNESGDVVVIREYACNMTAGDSIKAGQVETTVVGTVNPADEIGIMQSRKVIRFTGLADKADMSIYDMAGRAVLRLKYKQGEAIDMAAYPPGIYILQLQNGKVQKRFKVAL